MSSTHDFKGDPIKNWVTKLNKILLMFARLGLLLFLCVSPIILKAQNQPRVGFGFSSLINDPISLALGEATVALTGYSSASQINPATIGLDGFIELNSNISRLQGDGLRFQSPDIVHGLWRSTTSLSYGSDKYAVEFTYISNNSSRYKQTNFISFNRQALGVSMAYHISKLTWVGAGINYIYSRTEDVLNNNIPIKANDFSLDLGLYHSRTFDTESLVLKPALGLSLTDFGPTFSYSSGQEDGMADLSYALPLKMRLGVSFKAALKKKWHGRPYVSASLYGELSKQLSRTNDQRKPYGPFRALIGSWGSYQADNGSTMLLGDQIISHTSVEFSVMEILYGRLGYIKRPSKQYSFSIPSYGLGIDLYYVSLNYARIKTSVNNSGPYREKTNIWQITGKIPLNKNDLHNFWPDLINTLSHKR